MQQYRFTCCQKISTLAASNMDTCPYCHAKDPHTEEVDKDDRVIMGSFKILLDEPNVKVKKITVEPKQRLSLQLHKNRDEWWKVIVGEGEMQVGNSIFPISVWDTVEIERYQVHRVENTGDVDLVFVEVQTGECQEDDIIRVKDDYNRD